MTLRIYLAVGLSLALPHSSLAVAGWSNALTHPIHSRSIRDIVVRDRSVSDHSLQNQAQWHRARQAASNVEDPNKGTAALKDRVANAAAVTLSSVRKVESTALAEHKGATRASVRITSDSGGAIGAYLQRFESLRRSGENVIIDGPCLSACTLVLGTIPRDHLCVTSRARLGFHTAWRFNVSGLPVVSPDGTELLMSNYPAQIRDWIYRRGGLSPHLMYLTSRELASMYPTCQEENHSVIAQQNFGPAHGLSRPLSPNFASSREARRKRLQS
jgi:hypothetical protein